MKANLTQRIQARRRRELTRRLFERMPWDAPSMVFARYAALVGAIALVALYALGRLVP
jgi:hypothetical protein